jgi:hypothetical protein
VDVDEYPIPEFLVSNPCEILSVGILFKTPGVISKRFFLIEKKILNMANALINSQGSSSWDAIVKC